MPDDDRFSRDHGPGWKNVIDLYSRRKHTPPEGDPLSTNSQTPDRAHQSFASALRQTLDRLHPRLRPEDFHDAAALARRIARDVLRGDDDELCTSSSASGASGLLSQATRVVVARDGSDTTLTRSHDDLTEEIAREFLNGVGRRYGLDRVVMQTPESAFENALEVLAGIDTFLTGPAASDLVRCLLRGLDGAAHTSEVA